MGESVLDEFFQGIHGISCRERFSVVAKGSSAAAYIWAARVVTPKLPNDTKTLRQAPFLIRRKTYLVPTPVGLKLPKLWQPMSLD